MKNRSCRLKSVSWGELFSTETRQGVFCSTIRIDWTKQHILLSSLPVEKNSSLTTEKHHLIPVNNKRDPRKLWLFKNAFVACYQYSLFHIKNVCGSYTVGKTAEYIYINGCSVHFSSTFQCLILPAGLTGQFRIACPNLCIKMDSSWEA